MVKTEFVDYDGFEKCIRIYNEFAELIVSTVVGPRVLKYATIGGENHFYNNVEQAGKTGGDEWRTYGGHRLWTSPEKLIRTYEPDNTACEFVLLNDGVSLTSKPYMGLQKTLVVRLDALSSRVLVLHEVKNCSAWSIQFAPWALTVLSKEGMCAFPVSQNDTKLLPNRTLTLWPYAKMNDSRVYFGEKFMTLSQDTNTISAFKLGYPNEGGYAGYFNHNQLFVKRFGFEREAIYPDWNCNFETYTNADMLECETLSPLRDVEPNTSSVHIEEWELYDNIEKPDPQNERDLMQAFSGKTKFKTNF